MHSVQSIYDQLRRTDGDIERQIQQVKIQADHLGCTITEVMDANGGFLLSPLLVAKASCLNGIAVLKAAELKNNHR